MSRFIRASDQPDRHVAAVANSLQLAQESGQRGDYVDALAWVRVVEATGEQIPSEHETMRKVWLTAIESQAKASDL